MGDKWRRSEIYKLSDIRAAMAEGLGQAAFEGLKTADDGVCMKE